MRTTDEVEVYRVHYTSLDHVRISGWYCLPRERSGPLPAIIQVPWIPDGTRGYPRAVAKRGYAAFSAAPRGKVGSRDQFNPGYPGLLTYSIMDRNTYSYRGFYVDVWRNRRLPARARRGGFGVHRRGRAQPRGRAVGVDRCHEARNRSGLVWRPLPVVVSWTPSS